MHRVPGVITGPPIILGNPQHPGLKAFLRHLQPFFLAHPENRALVKKLFCVNQKKLFLTARVVHPSPFSRGVGEHPLPQSVIVHSVRGEQKTEQVAFRQQIHSCFPSVYTPILGVLFLNLDQWHVQTFQDVHSVPCRHYPLRFRFFRQSLLECLRRTL